jgi:hypothetical protein
MHCILHVKWSKRSAQTLKYIKLEGNDCYFRQNRSTGRGLRAVWLVFTLKLPCIPFCTLNGVKTALKRRNISNWKEMTAIFVKIVQLVAVCELSGLFSR